jgi:hypothetical protein
MGGPEAAVEEAEPETMKENVSDELEADLGLPTVDRQASLDCLDDSARAVAQAIADEYGAATSFEEVGSWRCGGAAFEDILTALQTEAMVSPEEGVFAEDMLELLTQGLTWDEIWLVLGLTE